MVGSTDVHEYALLLVVDALRTIGVEPVMAGTSVDPEEFAALAKSCNASAVLVSTHNGMALTYARQLRAALESNGLSVRIAMGGTLNEDIEGTETPLELVNELRQLGVQVCHDAADVVDLIESL